MQLPLKALFQVFPMSSTTRRQKCSEGQLSKKFQRKIGIIFLPISLKMCFGCSKELSHQVGSFEYPQHMFWLRNRQTIFGSTLLSGGLTYMSVDFT